MCMDICERIVSVYILDLQTACLILNLIENANKSILIFMNKYTILLIRRRHLFPIHNPGQNNLKLVAPKNSKETSLK